MSSSGTKDGLIDRIRKEWDEVQKLDTSFDLLSINHLTIDNYLKYLKRYDSRLILKEFPGIYIGFNQDGNARYCGKSCEMKMRLNDNHHKKIMKYHYVFILKSNHPAGIEEFFLQSIGFPDNKNDNEQGKETKKKLFLKGEVVSLVKC